MNNRSAFPMFGMSLYVEKAKGASDPNCLTRTFSHMGSFVMIRAAISWHSLGPVISLHGRAVSEEYI